MIKYDSVKVKVSYRNITHYIKLGYTAFIDEELEVITSHLPSSSHIRVDVICEICGDENNIMYCKYVENKKRHNFYGCRSCSRQKAALTSVDKYGVDNYSKTVEFKERVEKTNLEKFGYKTNLISPEYKKSIKSILKEKYGSEKFYEINRKNNSAKKFKLDNNIKNLINGTFELSEGLYDETKVTKSYIKYRGECRKLTKRNVRILYGTWDGVDYYDNENISENFKLDHNDNRYPTIDHKNSIYYGFVNKIPPSDISSVENLCITKRGINSRKRQMTESDFKNTTQ